MKQNTHNYHRSRGNRYGSERTVGKHDRESHSTNRSNSDITYKEYLYNYFQDVLVKWHLILLMAVAVAVIADTIYTVRYVPSYTTRASVIIKQESYDSKEDSLGDMAEALGYILSSDVFLNDLKKDLKVDEIHGKYTVTTMEGTKILKIKADADSPKISYRMMYYMLKHYKDVLKYVVGDTSIRVIEDIHVPVYANNYVNHKKNLAIFGLCGAAAMITLLILQSAMRDTIKCKDDIKNKLQIRILTDIAKESKWYMNGRKLAKKRGLVITQLSTSFTFVETFKRLGTRFEAETRKNGWKIVMINSTWEDEGKTSVITNLAIQLAQMNRKVLLVDTDFGKPALQKILDVEPEHGLEEALRGEKSFDEIIYHDKLRKLDCVFVKKVISDATSVLEGQELSEYFKSVRDQYDYILIDTPPASYLGMSMIIAEHCDAVLMVIRQNFTPSVLINRTIERYIGQESPVMGCVLNRSMPRFRQNRRVYR
ncbi:MAG: AAA family ATPase [Eubacteriales bacterium]|nr:AAA family ATPase [Eubacteriales bacterium]